MSQQTRRKFLQASALAGAGFWTLGGVTRGDDKPKSPNDKLNVAFVGIGGMGGGNLRDIARAGENVVGLCDVDDNRAGNAYKEHPKAKKFYDFRVMLDKLENQIDAVVVSTPDHCHAVAGMKAMNMGKHLYCEKPLTYCVYEARQMRETAEKQKVATCMGNRGTATDGFRSGVELIQVGAIGAVREVYVWTNRPGTYWKQGMDRPKGDFKVPDSLKWDLWLGPAAQRDFHPGLVPFSWRGWVDFGTGALGDMACHTINLAFMGLKLGYPTSVEAASSGMNGETYPLWETITYQFPKRGELPAVTLKWYDGMKEPGEQNLPSEEVLKGLNVPRNARRGVSGALLIGDKGIIYSRNDYGSDQLVLNNDREKMDFKRPEATLPRAPKQNNYLDWINACKGGRAALGNFSYAGLLTEVVVLGNVATRLGKKIDWNGEEMKATNVPEAEKLIRREYRKGYEL